MTTSNKIVPAAKYSEYERVTRTLTTRTTTATEVYERIRKDLKEDGLSLTPIKKKRLKNALTRARKHADKESFFLGKSLKIINSKPTKKPTKKNTPAISNVPATTSQALTMFDDLAPLRASTAESATSAPAAENPTVSETAAKTTNSFFPTISFNRAPKSIDLNQDPIDEKKDAVKGIEKAIPTANSIGLAAIIEEIQALQLELTKLTFDISATHSKNIESQLKQVSRLTTKASDLHASATEKYNIRFDLITELEAISKKLATVKNTNPTADGELNKAAGILSKVLDEVSTIKNDPRNKKALKDSDIAPRLANVNRRMKELAKEDKGFLERLIRQDLKDNFTKTLPNRLDAIDRLAENLLTIETQLISNDKDLAQLSEKDRQTPSEEGREKLKETRSELEKKRLNLEKNRALTVERMRESARQIDPENELVKGGKTQVKTTLKATEEELVQIDHARYKIELVERIRLYNKTNPAVTSLLDLQKSSGESSIYNYFFPKDVITDHKKNLAEIKSLAGRVKAVDDAEFKALEKASARTWVGCAKDVYNYVANFFRTRREKLAIATAKAVEAEQTLKAFQKANAETISKVESHIDQYNEMIAQNPTNEAAKAGLQTYENNGVWKMFKKLEKAFEDAEDAVIIAQVRSDVKKPAQLGVELTNFDMSDSVPKTANVPSDDREDTISEDSNEEKQMNLASKVGTFLRQRFFGLTNEEKLVKAQEALKTFAVANLIKYWTILTNIENYENSIKLAELELANPYLSNIGTIELENQISDLNALIVDQKKNTIFIEMERLEAAVDRIKADIAHSSKGEETKKFGFSEIYSSNSGDSLIPGINPLNRDRKAKKPLTTAEKDLNAFEQANSAAVDRIAATFDQQKGLHDTSKLSADDLEVAGSLEILLQNVVKAVEESDDTTATTPANSIVKDPFVSPNSALTPGAKVGRDIIDEELDKVANDTWI